MVYESDFYTTRRPYTRPISSHYTITVRMLPHHLPYIAHKKLVNVIHTPYPVIYHTAPVSVPIRIYSRVRPSVIAAELQRIRNLSRPYLGSYVSKYLNSKDHILFDDETREIRARADDLLRRVHVYVPRPTSSDFAEVITPERMRSDDFIRRVLTARKNAKRDEEPLNWYEHPETRQIGSGNLAGVAYVGGKPHSRRRPYYKVSDLRPADVQSDVNLLSFYAKNRQAAASAYPDPPPTEREIRKARALAEDREYVPRKASPDPEPVYKPDMASIYDSEEVVKPKKKSSKSKVVKVEKIEPEPIVEKQIVEEKIPEPEPVVESNSVLEKEAEIPEPETEPEPVVESNSVLEAEILEPEPEVTATEAEPAEEESQPEPEVESVLVEEPLVVEVEKEAEIDDGERVEIAQVENDAAEESTVAVEESDAAADIENQEEDEVLQRKLDEEELRRQVEELKRQAEEEKRRLAEEARLAEERWKAEIEERVRLEEEARQARLREIEEQERLEAERQAEEARIEAQRLLEEKLAEEERRAVEAEKAAALEEEERYVIEKAAEEARKRQEREEKLASEVAVALTEDEPHHESTIDECHCHDNVNSHDLEERPDSPDADDDTQIEEEAACISTDHDEMSEHPYDGEHEGFNSIEENDNPVENDVQIEEDFCFNNADEE